MNENINYNVPKEKLVFANTNKNIHDKELATKPIGYFKDAFIIVMQDGKRVE